MRVCAIGTALALLTTAACAGVTDREEPVDSNDSALNAKSDVSTLENGQPVKNDFGKAAAWSTAGSLDLTNEFHTPQGTNGRDCQTCHEPITGGWSVTPGAIQALFDSTGGTAPIFLPLDTVHPNSPVSTVEERRTAYRLLLNNGLFRRGGAPNASREYDIISVQDPYGFGSANTAALPNGRFNIYRRSIQTVNFHLTRNILWDGDRTRLNQTVLVALTGQATTAIPGLEAGPAVPSATTVSNIVNYELTLSFAQSIIPGVGALDDDGGKGGPANVSTQELKKGRFNLYDAWQDHGNARKAQIYRGQELFNTKTRTNGGGACGGCHNAENAGVHVKTNADGSVAAGPGLLFNVGTSDEDLAGAIGGDGLPKYTVKNRTTGATIVTTDPGAARGSGKWADMNKFKTPNLRGVAARAPYFHNGIAKDLYQVIDVYEAKLGFSFTAEEKDDLVAFLHAL
jgi:cytochrome c peroxidase